MMHRLLKPIATTVPALILLVGCSLAPQPLEVDQVVQIAHIDRETIFEGQEEITGELTLEVAMALALKYNLENRVRLLEETVADQQIGMSKQELLPSLALSAGYLERDVPNASRSVSISTGQESLEPSTSQDLEQANGNARFAWNLLDFGVSYLQAKQDADRYLIAQKAREKVMMTLLKEVRAAYWQAVAMDQMEDELVGISSKVDELLEHWQSVRSERLRPPVAVLMDIRALIETRQQLDEIRRSIDTARARLANLINAKDFRSMRLPVVDTFPEMIEISEDIEALELVALSNSTDYASEIYKVRIDQLESRKAMLRLLPGLEFSYGEHYDDNSFLLHQTWGELGLNLSGDLGQLFFVKQLKKFRESNEQLTISRKLAINMAVITGVHITWQDYQNSLKQLDRAEQLKEIDEQISLLTRNAEVNLRESGAAAIQTELRAFKSKISSLQSYADAQESYGEFIVSLGVNPIPENYEQRSVKDLALEVSSRLEENMFPYTREGEALLAERERMNQWVEKREQQLALEAEQAREAELALAEEIAAEQQAELDAERARQAEAEMIAEREKSEAEEAQEVLRRQAAALVARREAEAAEQKKSEAAAAKLAEAPVQMTTLAPDSTEYMKHFWLKYFPKPDMNSYLRHFIENLPTGPRQEQYLDLFIDKMKTSPDSRHYLKEFRALSVPASGE